jgi:predicted SprT family Zn-dependent metalloprotease
MHRFPDHPPGCSCRQTPAGRPTASTSNLDDGIGASMLREAATYDRAPWMRRLGKRSVADKHGERYTLTLYENTAPGHGKRLLAWSLTTREGKAVGTGTLYVIEARQTGVMSLTYFAPESRRRGLYSAILKVLRRMVGVPLESDYSMTEGAIMAWEKVGGEVVLRDEQPVFRMNPVGGFDEDLGDYVAPGEVVVADGSCSCGDVNEATRCNPVDSATGPGSYASLAEITAVIDRALGQYGWRPGRVDVAFTPGGSSRAGFCGYVPATSAVRIRFNKRAWPAFTPEERLNTVLHEAAHAIDYLTTGRSSHGPNWKMIARSIGCTGDRCLSVEATDRMREVIAASTGRPPPRTHARIQAAKATFQERQPVAFDVKGTTLHGIITAKEHSRARVVIRQGLTFQVPYDMLRPSTAEAVATLDLS